MNKTNDIRPQKMKLRQKYKDLRIALTAEEKERLDVKITNRLLNMWQYRQTQIILSYVSTEIEVDTRRIIEKAISDGKTVAVPRCIDGTVNMDFYIIKSFDDLEIRTFGVMEPIPQRCERLTDFSKGVCIVPALAFDKNGYRLGYGKGYYDRFLSNFSGETLGICYNACIVSDLPHGKYDRRVEKIISENDIIMTDNKKGGST